jgi:uncharacterized protein
VKERLPLLVGLTFLAVAIGVGSDAIANGIRDRNQSNVITVTGSAKKRIVSDYIIWDASLTSQQPTPQKAAAELAAWSERVRSFLVDAGAKPEELTLQPISTDTITEQNANGESTGRISAYKLTRTFEIRSSRSRRSRPSSSAARSSSRRGSRSRRSRRSTATPSFRPCGRPCSPRRRRTR